MPDKCVAEMTYQQILAASCRLKLWIKYRQRPICRQDKNWCRENAQRHRYDCRRVPEKGDPPGREVGSQARCLRE